MKHPIGVCSWSYQKPLMTVAEEMRRIDVKCVHLALQPFLEGDARHGAAEGALVRGYVEGLIDAGAWKVTAAMLSFSYEDYTTPVTIRKTGGIVPDEHWDANKKLIRNAAKMAAQFKTLTFRSTPDTSTRRVHPPSRSSPTASSSSPTNAVRTASSCCSRPGRRRPTTSCASSAQSRTCG